MNGKWRTILRHRVVCHLSDLADIDDEYHDIMSCTYIKDGGSKYFTQYHSKNLKFIKYKQICSTQNCVEFNKLCRFIKSMYLKGFPPG